MAHVTIPDAPALLVGRTRHRRHRPHNRSFALNTFTALLDVDELDALNTNVKGFAVNRFHLTGFSPCDHLDRRDVDLRTKLAEVLNRHGYVLPAGKLLLLANVKQFGYVFDPVSWWFCFHPNGDLAYVIAEVHNTFHEQHLYLLDTFQEAPSGQLRAHTAKVFHVSPFLPIEPLNYTFTFRITKDALACHIDVDDVDGRLFDATQYGTLIPFTTATLWRTIATHPLMTLRTIVRIHREALVLLVRRLPFHRKPAPPLKDLT